MPLSALTKIGIAKETTWGTGVASAYWLPVEPPGINLEVQNILDNGLRGIPSKDFGSYAGVKSVAGGLSGPVFPEEIGPLLLSMFGGEAASGTAAPYSHDFTVNGTPPSLTIEVSDSVQARRYLGCHLSSLTLTYNGAEGLLTYSADVVGRDMETMSEGTFSEPASGPWQGWRASLTLGGSAYAKVATAEITFAREVSLFYALANTQLAGFRDCGPMEVTGRLTAYFNANADYNKYIDNTQEALVLTITQGSGGTARTLTITCTNVSYLEAPAEIDRSGVNLALNLSFRALYNATDAGPAEVVLSNATSGAY